MMKSLKIALAGALFVMGMSAAAAAGLYTNGLPAAPTPLTGLEQIPLDTELPGGQSPQTAWITSSSLQNDAQYVAATNTTAFTATAAQMTGKSFTILDLTGTSTAAAITTPTAALLIAAYPLMSSGGYILRIINRANSGSWTLTAGTGVTLTGTVAIATTTYRDYFVTSPTTTTVTMQAIGSGTN